MRCMYYDDSRWDGLAIIYSTCFLYETFTWSVRAAIDREKFNFDAAITPVERQNKSGERYTSKVRKDYAGARSKRYEASPQTFTADDARKKGITSSEATYVQPT